MRIVRWMIVMAGLIGGMAGLSPATNAAPLPASTIAAQAEPSLAAKAYYGYRRPFYRRPFFHRRPFYRRPFYRRPFFHRRPFFRRRFF